MGKRTTTLPKYVRKHRAGFRAVLTVSGRLLRGPTVDTAEEAAAWAEQLRARRTSGGDWTLQEAFDALLAELQVTTRPATVSYYRNHWRLVAGCIDPSTRASDLLAKDVMELVAQRHAAGVGASTIWGKDLQVLSRVLGMAEREGHVVRNVICSMPRPRVRQRRFDALATEQVEDMLDQIRGWGGRVRTATRDADIIDLFFSTGIRLSEMARLRAVDVNFGTGELRIDGKTGERLLPLRIETLEILRRFARRASNGPLIGSVDKIEKAIGRWQKRLGEPRLHAHALRHSYATAMARADVSPYVLRDLMGHATLQQTLRYYHTQGDQMRAAASAIPRRMQKGEG